MFAEIGCHLVHNEIVNQVPEIKNYKIGMANIFCKLNILLISFLYIKACQFWVSSAAYLGLAYAERKCGS